MIFNWEAIGAIGEVVGAAGVILTLAYLALQMRQNTTAQRRATAQATVSSLTSWYELGAADPDFALLWTKGMARSEELSDEERTRFIWMIARLFSTLEETFAQYQHGMVAEEKEEEEEEWDRWRTLMRSWLENDVIGNWWASGATVYTSSFIRDVTPDIDVAAWTRESIVEATESSPKL